MAIAQSAEAVEYTNCFSTEELDNLPNKCFGYDTKQSDGEAPVILEFCGMQSAPLLPSLPGPLWPRVVATDRVLSMVQIELNCVLMLNWIVWNRTVYMYKNEFIINNLQWLMYHKTKPNQTKPRSQYLCHYLKEFWSGIPQFYSSPISWGYRIHQLHLCREVRNPLLPWVSQIWH